MSARLQMGRRRPASPPPAFAAAEPRGPGKPLERDDRTAFAARFGHSFEAVRVHTGPGPDAAAHAAGAAAYALGDDLVFADGAYAPDTPAGRRLLAHELAHVAQQRVGGVERAGAEPRARAAAGRAAAGETVPASVVGGAPPGLYAQEATEERREPPPVPRFTVSWSEASRYRLPPPSLLAPPPTPSYFNLPQLTLPTFGPTLSGAGSGGTSGAPVTHLPGPSPFAPTPATLSGITPGPTPFAPATVRDVTSGGLPPPTPAPSTAGGGQPAPSAPSRLPLVTTGAFSLGLRLGFPSIDPLELPGADPTTTRRELQQAEIFDFTLREGRLPSSWELVDKGQLAGIVWSIFATHIAPDVARRITSGLSTPVGGGYSAQLDLVLLTGFDGGGLSFTLTTP